MPSFSYSGRDSKGKAVNGTISAVNADSVVEQLINLGINPLKITEVAGGGPGGAAAKGGLFAPWPSEDELILFSRQMYTLTKSGVPMVRSLQGLIDSTHNFRLVSALKKMVDDLQAGRDLSAAMGEHPRVFNRLYTRIVRMGEETGRLDQAFLQLYQYMEVEKETKQKVKSALRYPTFVMLAMAVGMFILNYWVIPSFAKTFEKFGSNLPLPTQILMGISKFVVDYAGLIVLGFFGTIYAIQYYIKTPAGRLFWDQHKLRMPIVGSIVNRATMSRFARAFAMGSGAGLAINQTLNTVSEAVDNAYVGGKVLAMQADIERGISLIQAAYASEMFTPLVLQMMAVGEETGQVDTMMLEVAQFYEREVDYDVKNLSSAIEPIMLTIIGVMVLTLALGIFLPMWDLGSAAMKKH